jgi:chromosome segregation ATPase
VHDFILRAAEDAAAARGLLSSAKGSRGGGAADVARKIETAVAEAEASWREEMTDLTRAHALELEETREETREARRRAEEAIARAEEAERAAEEAEEKIEDETSTVAATAALEDAMSLVEATRAKLAAAKESEARAIASRDAAEAAAEAERDARGELAAERARLRSELERASATSRDLESALRDARDATKRAVDDAVAAFKESNPPPPDVLTLASMREELDAMRRVAEIQEREVVRATAAAAESAAAGGLDAAAAAASVPQALLERWRGEVFRLLLQLRQDPIVAKEEARIAAR